MEIPSTSVKSFLRKVFAKYFPRNILVRGITFAKTFAKGTKVILVGNDCQSLKKAGIRVEQVRKLTPDQMTRVLFAEQGWDVTKAQRLATICGGDCRKLRIIERYFEDAGFASDTVSMRYQMNLRYPGQNWSLTVEITDGLLAMGEKPAVDDSLCEEAVHRFHALHEKEYGHRRDEESPEITGVRLVTTAVVPTPRFGGGSVGARREVAPLRHREANLGRGFESVGIYRGPDLVPGDVVSSPAIIEETLTTIVVYPGWEAVLDESSDYLLRYLG